MFTTNDKDSVFIERVMKGNREGKWKNAGKQKKMTHQQLACLFYDEIVFSGKSELYQEWLHRKSAYTHFTGVRTCQLFCFKITVLSKDHLLKFLARGSLMILLLTPT